jgi:hypothetical protein
MGLFGSFPKEALQRLVFRLFPLSLPCLTCCPAGGSEVTKDISISANKLDQNPHLATNSLKSQEKVKVPISTDEEIVFPSQEPRGINDIVYNSQEPA